MARHSRKPCHPALLWVEAVLLASASAGASNGASAAAAADDQAYLAAATEGRLTPFSGSAPPGLSLMLLVTVNGRERGVVPVLHSENAFWVSQATLGELGIAVPEGSGLQVRFDSLQGIILQYHEDLQSLEVMVPPVLLDARMARLNQDTAANPAASEGTGVVLNYDLAMHSYDGASELGMLSGLRIFGPTGVLETTAVSQWSFGDGGTFRSVRLDSAFTHNFPDKRLTLRIGDTITSGTAWTRPARIGGIQIGTDFGLQPYFVTSPVRTLESVASLPSRVELFVNGMRRYSGEVAPGPFEIGLGPGRIDGAGNAQVIVTDMLGRVTTENFAIYDSSRLLRRGLSDWSAEIGAVRRGYGLSSFDYDTQPALSMTWRQGLSDSLTFETHAEARSGLATAGVGTAIGLGEAGIVTASASRSTGKGSKGHQATIGYSWAGHSLNVSAEMRRSSGNYRDLAANRNSPAPPNSDYAQAGYSSGIFGTFGVSYLRLQPQGEDAYRYAGVFWNDPIGRRASLRLSYNHNFEESRRSGFLLTLSLTPSNRVYADAGYELRGGQSRYKLSVQQSAPLSGGFGWRADLQEGADGLTGGARINALTDYGDVSAAFRSVRGRAAFSASYSGALALMDGSAFISRRIDNGFAIVSTDGLGDVPVLVANQIVGRTNGAGRLLVTRLNPWQQNLVAIDTRDLPPSVMPDQVSALVVPSDRAGVRVRFALRQFRAVTLTAITADGEVLPPGSTVTIAGSQAAPTILGFDGLLYLEDPPAGARLLVDAPKGPCALRLPQDLGDQDIAQLGRQICELETARLAGPASGNTPTLDYLPLPETGRMLMVVDEQGRPLAQGSRVSVAGDSVSAPNLGPGAMLYLASVPTGSRMTVTTQSGACQFAVPEQVAVKATTDTATCRSLR